MNNIPDRLPQVHYLKTDSSAFHDVATGKKTFEFRKNDRDFTTGDILILYEYPAMGLFIVCQVLHMLHGGKYGVPEGYVIMSIHVLGDNLAVYRKATP